MKQSPLRQRNVALRQRQQLVRQQEPYDLAVAKMQAAVAKLEGENKSSSLDKVVQAMQEQSRRFRKFLSPEARLALWEQEEAEEQARYWSQVAHSIHTGKLVTFYESILEYGPRTLAAPEVQEALLRLWDKAVSRGDEQATATLEKICPPLAWRPTGRRPEYLEKWNAIIASCKKWYPICEGLNKDFKKLWRQEESQSSELDRKEARGQLAEKWSISRADVRKIESYLQKPSRTASKSTPFSAMIRMVAHEFPGIGEKTVEKIWEDYLRRRPEESRKRRSTR